MIKKKEVKNLYNLPNEIIFCKECTISNQRPRITFDKMGVCSACNYKKFKRNNIDWEFRESELLKLCEKYRKNNGEYDVVVPCSGGKDGSFVAHQLKNKYGMNPLCVTWAPTVYTDQGRKNLDSFINSGFNHILGTSDPVITKKLTYLSFRELGDPFQPFIYGQSNFPLFMALNYEVKLIMYGENGEVEYGGDMKNAYTPTRSIKDYNKHYFSGIGPDFWEKYNILSKDLHPFKGPPENLINQKGIEMHFFGYYKFWDPQENFYYAQKNCGFTVNNERNEGTYSKYASLDDKLDSFHYYLAYIKFGIGRATSDTAHEIRDGKINRDEGIQLVKKYDGEFPSKYYNVFLDYCDLTDSDFNEILDQWRSDHIWYKENNNWKLRKTIWEE